MRKSITFLIMLSFIYSCSSEFITATLDVQKALSFESFGGHKTISLETNVNDWTAAVGSAVDWCSAVIKDAKTLEVEVKPNKAKVKRTTSILVKAENLTKQISISQDAYDTTIDIEADHKVTIASATASTQQPSSGIVENSFDNNYNTFYHSNWGIAVTKESPAVLTYNFENQDFIDYVIIYGRSIGVNGRFKEFDVFAKSQGAAEVKISSHNFNGEGGVHRINLDVNKPEYIKFVVYSGVNNNASCAEMEFYKLSAANEELYALFTDKSCSVLKPSVTLEEIEKTPNTLLRNIAKQLLDNTYKSDYIVADYKAIKSPAIIGQELKIGNGFSRYENITGVYLSAGEHVVMVGPTNGKDIGLRLPNWMRKSPAGTDPTADTWSLLSQNISLAEGINIINVGVGTNAYINYYEADPTTSPTIRVHFPTGEVNGYFDSRKHTNDDWNSLLDEAVSPVMDAVGKHIQVAYPVEYFKKFTYSKGLELLTNYDEILDSHYTFNGFKKYNKIPQNRILARVNFQYYMFRDADGVAYLGNESTMGMVANPSVIVTGDPCWGFSHEVGHVLQMNPQLNWAGMGEVSNNFFTMYTTTKLGVPSRLKNEGQYQKARKKLIEANPKISPFIKEVSDFERLVPFWQLHLYFTQIGKPDFYADLMEKIRLTPTIGGTGANSYHSMFEFIKMSCDIGKTDLTDFFEEYGFFFVGNIPIEDYGGPYVFRVTQEKVDEVKSYIAEKKYPKPTLGISKLEDLK